MLFLIPTDPTRQEWQISIIVTFLHQQDKNGYYKHLQKICCKRYARRNDNGLEKPEKVLKNFVLEQEKKTK